MLTLTVPAEIRDLIDAGALFAVNNSGGKDSQAMLALLRQVVPARQLMVVHAHLAGEEWDGVEDHVREISAGLDVVIAEPAKTFVQMVERRGMFPSPQQRQCTSDLKRGPIDREIRRYLAKHPEFGGLVVSCQGMRAQESTSRSKLQALKVNQRNSIAGRRWFDWLPIHDLSADQVFQAIAEAGQQPHWAYRAGMTRLSCMFCIMASQADLRTAARLNPEAYRDRVLLERRIRHTMNMEGRSLEDVTGIRIDAQAEPELVIGADVAGDDQVEDIEAIVAIDAIEADDQVEQLELADAAIEAELDAHDLAAAELVEELAQDPAEALPVVYLVSCTKSKAAGASPARELYAPSDWFAKARAYVEAQRAAWFILSAEHGLVEPGQLLEPYETTLLRMRKPARRAWAELVIGQLAARRLLGRARFVLLAGETYREFLEPWLSGEGRWPELAQVPLRGLGLGDQKAWLARAAGSLRSSSRPSAPASLDAAARSAAGPRSPSRSRPRNAKGRNPAGDPSSTAHPARSHARAAAPRPATRRPARRGRRSAAPGSRPGARRGPLSIAGFPETGRGRSHAAGSPQDAMAAEALRGRACRR